MEGPRKGLIFISYPKGMKMKGNMKRSFRKLRGGSISESSAYSKARTVGKTVARVVKKRGPAIARNLAIEALKGNIGTGNAVNMGISLLQAGIISHTLHGVGTGLYRTYGNVIDKVQKVPPSKKGGPVKNLPKDTKIVPQEGSIAAVVGTRQSDIINYQGLRTYRLCDTFHDGPKSASLILAQKLYKSTTITYYSTEKSNQNKLYAYGGLNQKGVINPFQNLPASIPYTDIDTLTDASIPVLLNFTAGMFGQTMADRAIMLFNGLLQNNSTSVNTEMPPISVGGIDYYYPIQSWESKISITNTDTYLPCEVKIYLLQARKDCDDSPQQAWYQRNVGPGVVQDVKRMDIRYVGTPTDELISGLNPTAVTVRTGSYIHPQSTPGMSETFKDTYKILKVRQMTLQASETLEYTLKRHFANPMSAADYQQTAAFNRRKEGDLDIMVEFQGKRVAYYRLTDSVTPVFDYSGMAHCCFSKIRYTIEKKFTHSFPVARGLGLYNPASSQYTPSFIGTKQMPLVLYDDTAPYTKLSTNVAVAGNYYVPVTSDSSKYNVAPLISDPV